MSPFQGKKLPDITWEEGIFPTLGPSSLPVSPGGWVGLRKKFVMLISQAQAHYKTWI